VRFWEENRGLIIKAGLVLAVMAIIEFAVAGRFSSQAASRNKEASRVLKKLKGSEAGYTRRISKINEAIAGIEDSSNKAFDCLIYQPVPPYVCDQDVSNSKLHYANVLQDTRVRLRKMAQANGVSGLPFSLGFSDEIPENEAMISGQLLRLGVTDDLVRRAYNANVKSIVSIQQEKDHDDQTKDVGHASKRFRNRLVVLEAVFAMDDIFRFIHAVQDDSKGRFLAVQGISLRPANAGCVQLKISMLAVTVEDTLLDEKPVLPKKDDKPKPTGPRWY